MLYVYEGKVYVRPFDYKMVEVNVTKKGNEYNVQATEKWIYIDEEIRKNIYDITVEKAYEMQNSKKTKNFDLD